MSSPAVDGTPSVSKGIVLPVRSDGKPCFSQSGHRSEGVDYAAVWKSSNAKPRPGEVRLFYGQGSGKDTTVALVGTGKLEGLSENELLERARAVAAVGVKALREVGVTKVEIETGTSDATQGGLDPHAVATAVRLALHKHDWKTSAADKEKKAPVDVSQLGSAGSSPEDVGKTLSWATGTIFADAQNLARELMDTPANLMTPTIFTDRAKKEFSGLEGVTVNVYDEAWAQEKGMRTFLSVAAGTDEPAKFLEIVYKGASSSDDTEVAFVGKGITFDSGGISLKPGADMKAMRADMGGAATTLSSLWAIAKLKFPINMVLCIPLTENLPSGKATKPGDIIVSMSGKTVEVDNTDAEGRLVLADALFYATSVYKPRVVIDVATLTGAMMIALGEVYAGVFSTDDTLWEQLNAAGMRENDEFWRMPFHDKYLKWIDGTGADLCNTGGRMGGSCTAAIFLKQFIAGLDVDKAEQKELDENQANTVVEEKAAKIAYAHIDIAGVMSLSKGAQAYDVQGMSGKPVRALTEFVRARAYKLRP